MVDASELYRCVRARHSVALRLTERGRGVEQKVERSELQEQGRHLLWSGLQRQVSPYHVKCYVNTSRAHYTRITVIRQSIRQSAPGERTRMPRM